MEFSTRSLHHLIHDQTSKRVSKSAADKLAKTLERFAGDIAEEAIAVAQEDGYQTVKRKHVRRALNS
ncbi:MULTISPECIES: histone [Halorussus]|uniref:histone n=1 Tax=Halorussus TaxID=1070314 RepID=UPI0020A0F3EA|nr:histone [Halorussus vallis]USZ77578.1 NFYB/HAP3 family transcription factor subunit [Halorussus vallis]